MSYKDDLINCARDLLARPPELRGPFNNDEDALRKIAAFPLSTEEEEPQVTIQAQQHIASNLRRIESAQKALDWIEQHGVKIDPRDRNGMLGHEFPFILRIGTASSCSGHEEAQAAINVQLRNTWPILLDGAKVQLTADIKQAKDEIRKWTALL